MNFCSVCLASVHYSVTISIICGHVIIVVIATTTTTTPTIILMITFHFAAFCQPPVSKDWQGWWQSRVTSWTAKLDATYSAGINGCRN